MDFPFFIIVANEGYILSLIMFSFIHCLIFIVNFKVLDPSKVSIPVLTCVLSFPYIWPAVKYSKPTPLSPPLVVGCFCCFGRLPAPK